MRMVELIDKWEVVSKLITLQNNYNFFKNEWDAERLCREIAKMEIGIGKTPGLELVRCKDCKKWYRHTLVDRERGDCRRYQTTKHESGFCDKGERRTNDERTG